MERNGVRVSVRSNTRDDPILSSDGVSGKPGAVHVAGVQFSEDAVSVELADGRTISAPLVWYPRLLNASEADRNAWELAAGGYGIHWPTIDEDLSVEGLLRGSPAHGEGL